VGEAFNQATIEAQLRVAGQPRISEKEQATEGEMAFDAIFEVYPEVKMQDLAQVTIDKLKADVTDEAIDKTVEILRKQRRTYAQRSLDSTADTDDRVTVDFEGKIDGEPFDGGRAQDFQFAVGEGQMLQEFEAAVKGMKVGEKKFMFHLDGYDLSDSLAGKAPSPRHEFFYFNDDGSLVALRFDQWKLVFSEQRAIGLDVWQDPFVPLRFPKLFNLRSDPFETADHESINYGKWRIDRAFLLVPAQQYIAQFLGTFKDFPPSQKGGTFSLDSVLEQLSQDNN
jgi:FKBP-type peptidyl-prolyl cis-trans isomerase